MTAPLLLDGSPLDVADVVAVARDHRPLALDPAAAERLARARGVVERRAAAAPPTYGVNTGFGSLSRRRIEPDQVRDVQRNLVRSHAAGVGAALDAEVVRAMGVVLAASLARGHSGARPELVTAIIDLLNADVVPVVPEVGSVGASGDLAPLSHFALVLLGEGEAMHRGVRMPGAEALAAAELRPVTLEAKEGLALINGTHLMAATLALAVADLSRLRSAAVVAAAMAIDACRATDAFLDPRLHAARCQPGQIRVAGQLRALLEGSTILPAHLENDPRVQDPYCLRAMPQVLGAAFDALDSGAAVLERELGAVTDNPLLFADDAGGGDIVSGGNFHGMPLAIAADAMKIALCHVAGIAERRVYWLLAASDGENPVNPYLSPIPGLHSGLMIVQYTAAACCNELQMLASPASVANIPTSAGIEDYNSMGATSVRQLRRAVERAREVIAIELLVMAEALEYQRPLRSGAGVEAAHELVRRVVPRLVADRPPAPDVAAIVEVIARGTFGADAPSV